MHLSRRRPTRAMIVAWCVVASTFVFAQAQDYNQAPALAEQVEAGQLPPVEERLPTEPMVVEPFERIGEYGGTWRTVISGASDLGHLYKTMAYEQLVRWNPEWTEVIPNIAESFEVNGDATEFTFKLREGVKWSDGAPFTADDIMFWYEDVLLNEALGLTPPTWLVSGGEPVVVEKVDDTTVVFRFSTPNGLFLQTLATPEGHLPTVWPKHYLEQFHPRYNEAGLDALVQEAGVANWVELWEQRIGMNLFEVARWQNTELPVLTAWKLSSPYDGNATRVTAERNPYYWKVDTEGNQLPYLDNVHYEVVQDGEVALLKALNGELDFQNRHIGTVANRPVAIDNQEQGNYTVINTPTAYSSLRSIELNLNHKDPVKREIFNNKDFRIGLSHAINRQEFSELLTVGFGEPWQVAPLEGTLLYNEQLAKQYTEYDLDLANEHLDRAGYSERDGDGFRLGPDGKRISFTLEAKGSDPPDDLELIKGYFSEVGVDMQIRPMDRSLWEERRRAGEHDAVPFGGGFGSFDALLSPIAYFPFSHESAYAPAWAAWYYDRQGTSSETKVRSEEPPAEVKRQMELYDQLKATGDQDRQIELMKEILEITADQFYAIGTVTSPPLFAIVKNNFHNVPEMPEAWLYPAPGPTNPETYFISQQ